MKSSYFFTHLTQLTLILTPRPPLQQLERGSKAAVKSTWHSGEGLEVGKNASLRKVSSLLCALRALCGETS